MYKIFDEKLSGLLYLFTNVWESLKIIGQKPLQNNGNFTTVTIGKVNNSKSDQRTEKTLLY